MADKKIGASEVRDFVFAADFFDSIESYHFTGASAFSSSKALRYCAFSG